MRERVFYCITFYLFLSMPTGYNKVVYCHSRILISDSLERRFIRKDQKTIKQTNKRMKKNIHYTTRWTWLELSRKYNSVTEKLWGSHPSSMIEYTTFSLSYFHLNLLLFIFNDVTQCNRFNFISSNGRKQPLNNGRRTGGEKWVSSYR